MGRLGQSSGSLLRKAERTITYAILFRGGHIWHVTCSAVMSGRILHQQHNDDPTCCRVDRMLRVSELPEIGRVVSGRSGDREPE